jgi:hypothetical protein
MTAFRYAGVSKYCRFTLMTATSASAQRLDRLIAIFGVVHAETSRAQGRAVGLAEVTAEVVRAAAGDQEHLRLAGLPRNRLRLGQRRVALAALPRARRLCASPADGCRPGTSTRAVVPVAWVTEAPMPRGALSSARPCIRRGTRRVRRGPRRV